MLVSFVYLLYIAYVCVVDVVLRVNVYRVLASDDVAFMHAMVSI